MKIIALDVGTKRIGLAKADTDVKIAIPSGAITVNGTELNRIKSFAKVYGTDFFVVGLPRNSRGEETAQSAYVHSFVKRLKRAIPTAKVKLQDESLTSVMAQERLQKRKSRYTRGDIDAEAAAIILQDFLEEFLINSSKRQKSGQKAKKKKHLARNIIISVLVVLVLAGAGGYIFYRANLAQVDPKCCDATTAKCDCETKTFTVKENDGISVISKNLQETGLIRNALVFQARYYLGYRNQTLKAGTYQLSVGMTVNEIIESLVAGAKDNVFSLTIVPGENLMDIKKKLEGVGYKSEEIEAAFKKKYDNKVLEDKPAEASLEGYIFGDTYEFYKTDSVEKIIQTTLESLEKVIEKNDLKTKFAAKKLSLYQGITLASVVQKEAKTVDDMKKVVQVFYKRLESDMPLGSDPTVKYAVDLVDLNRQTYKDDAAVLEIESPYNTRKNKGLPYGPISNPGEDALMAVVNPAETDYLYFLTGDDNMMYYSKTEAEHQRNIADHCQTSCGVKL